MEIKLKNGKTVTIVTSWDDGSRYDLRIRDMLLHYHLPGVFYIPTIVRELTDEQVQDIAKTHEIGAHTETHRHLRLIGAESAKEEINGCKEALESITGRPVTSFCYPKGKYSPETVEMVKAAGYTDARCVDVGAVHRPHDPFRTATSVHVFPRRREYKGETWMLYGRKLFDMVMDPNDNANYFHIWGHGWEIDQEMQWQELELFFSYMQWNIENV